jgi:hypothetical protein
VTSGRPLPSASGRACCFVQGLSHSTTAWHETSPIHLPAGYSAHTQHILSVCSTQSQRMSSQATAQHSTQTRTSHQQTLSETHLHFYDPLLQQARPTWQPPRLKAEAGCSFKRIEFQPAHTGCLQRTSCCLHHQAHRCTATALLRVVARPSHVCNALGCDLQQKCKPLDPSRPDRHCHPLSGDKTVCCTECFVCWSRHSTQHTQLLTALGQHPTHARIKDTADSTPCETYRHTHTP